MILKEMKLLLRHVVDLAIILFEFADVFVILIAGARGVQDYVGRNPRIRLNLAIGTALGLEFELSSEILHTVVVRELAEIATVVAIIVLRTALTFLIRWKTKVRKADEEIRHHHEIPEKV